MLHHCLRRALLTALLVLPAAFFGSEAQAQAPKTYSSSEILLGLKKLNVLGSVLYIAAHPDDENTRLIAYMANGRLLETGYFSCTRGDGGQNLIGPELREQLGVIRTQELLAARRIDGGRQFFSRANDFGFSKTAEETFKIWDKEQVLADMVWVIRQRRPDVLITRFPPDARAGHGHHTASAILAAEAFDAAGDPKRFPEQLQYVQPWQPKRLFWNTGSFFVKPGEDMSGYLKVDAGGYNALLGQSYGEIAARSRSQHRSQGFGSAATRGEALEYLQLVKGDKVSKDPFEGVDMSWNRVKGGAAVGKLLDEVIRKYDASKPEGSVPGLLKVREVLFGLLAKEDNGRFWQIEKLEELDALIKQSVGLHLEVTAASPSAVYMPSGTMAVSATYEIVNRSNLPIQLLAKQGVVGNEALAVTSISAMNGMHGNQGKRIDLPTNTRLTDTISIKGSVSTALVSQPYWLRDAASIGMYSVKSQIDRGKAENDPAALVHFRFLVGGQMFMYNVPVQYKRVDPAFGEIYQPVAVVPPVAVNLVGRAYVFADNQPKTVPVTLKAGRANAKGTVALQVPANWKVEPASIPFDILNKDEERTVTFQMQPADKNSPESSGQLRAVATLDGQPYTRGIQTINYPHIPVQTLFLEAVAPLVKLDLKRRNQEIGYLMGAGDEVPDALRQIGYNVTLLKPEDLNAGKLKRYDAVVLGVRAYNTIDRLKYLQKELLEYVEKGGNMVVQYTVNSRVVLPEIGPYSLKLSNDRVTVEDAPVTITKPQHPLMAAPNKITTKDFEGWQQEQGLYYPSSWDPKYQTVISSHDPGETPKESAILVTDYGKGHYIYTGLSFFRELPAGVPGAYRLITNMIELGKDKAN
ncbi:PIG-L family deacetylase [Hymenobacter busanensis]|uniref:PIG-L family deacetylase n=1 Tax=Hymenobacter busanensis TaxID=2607656 RepID=A0A7L5A0I4_9BACT|nr:PIG-L family deacetylase [Hymenobacter busanensis]KAA9332423.1 PIG-L family deacetylase [Hymenobacter busanensis]QHJ07240.1 LmbE family protein [Hymenobacter busanensis]